MTEWIPARATARVAALQLAHGSVPSTELDWKAVIDAAIAERCAPLAWLRSSDTIRRMAPPAVVAQWRRHMLCAAEHSVLQARELTSLARLLDDQGVRVVVLKGLPLSALLYDDIAARPSTDFDLFIEPQDRAAAHRALVEAGWEHMRGAPPLEALYQRRTSAACPWLEIHSSLLDENLLAHLVVPPPSAQRVDLGEGVVDAHWGSLLPLFLAAHLAKHTDPPLLWWTDFATAYGRLDTSGREALARHALALRLNRYLDWAIRGAEMLSHALAGPIDEAASWLLRLQAHGHGHNAARVVMLAESPYDKLAIMSAWIWPREARWNPELFVRQAWYRLSGLRSSIERWRRPAPGSARSA